MKKKYIAYIDVLGTKNYSENDNFDAYINLIINFQDSLIKASKELNRVGRIYFFSDCAYIESENLNSIVKTLILIRDTLFDNDIFIRGALTKGELGALNNFQLDDKEYISQYDNSEYRQRMQNSISLFKQQKSLSTVIGTLFFSRDISIAYRNEAATKGTAICVDKCLEQDFKAFKSINDDVSYVKSGYIPDLKKNTYISFYDLKYDPELITDAYVEKVLMHYTLSNTADVKYGRYYLTMLISCVNSSDFSRTKYDRTEMRYIDSPQILEQILQLKKKHSLLYRNAKGLEYLYFSLIDKFYTDVKNSSLRLHLLKDVFSNQKFMTKYQNRISQLPSELLSSSNKNDILKDIVEVNYNYK